MPRGVSSRKRIASAIAAGASNQAGLGRYRVGRSSRHGTINTEKVKIERILSGSRKRGHDDKGALYRANGNDHTTVSLDCAHDGSRRGLCRVL
jgi:hypothetical protein